MSKLQFRSDSLVAHVCKFFAANPDDTLDLDAISVKWDTPRAGIHTRLAAAIEAELLVRETTKDLELVYRRGPKLEVAADSVPSGTALSRALRPPTPIAAVDIDPAAVPLEDGVPLPAKARGRKPVDWGLLLGRMKPGQSAVLPVSKRAKVGKACKAAKDESRGEYQIHVETDKQTFRVWRVA